ncbi:hypothetical protein ACFE04_011856 [Oxalis oulophora]
MASSEDSQFFQWQFNVVEIDTHAFFNARALFFLLLCLCMLLLIVMFFLYAHWVSKYRHISPTTSISIVGSSSTSSLGLDRDGINSLPIILFQRNPDHLVNVEEIECCICLAPFEVGDKLKVLPKCKHSFHSDCVDMWLTTHSSCPLCRGSLQIISVDKSALP